MGEEVDCEVETGGKGGLNHCLFRQSVRALLATGEERETEGGGGWEGAGLKFLRVGALLFTAGQLQEAQVLFCGEIRNSPKSPCYRVAKTHRIPYLYRSFSAKVTYI